MAFNGAMAWGQFEFCALGACPFLADCSGKACAWKTICKISVDRPVLYFILYTGDMGYFCGK